MCGGGVCVGGGGCAFYYTYIIHKRHHHIIIRKRESYEGAELVGDLVAETIHPSCMCEGGGRGGERGGRAFYYTYIYSGKRESCEGAELVGRERVLFIGTQFSILYTSMYSPAEAATQYGCRNHPSCVYV